VALFTVLVIPTFDCGTGYWCTVDIVPSVGSASLAVCLLCWHNLLVAFTVAVIVKVALPIS
jgi:hypothetical protein